MSAPAAATGPLAGMRILDLSTLIVGPYATQILGDYGADIIKVEAPDGDIMRNSGPARGAGMGHMFLHANRNKRSVVLDLKREEGRQAVLALARGADALIYNLRPAAMDRLGLGHDAVAAVNPGIVYAGAFGFSQRGPYADRPAYDDLIQGMAGIASLSAIAAGEPRYAPLVLADRVVALQLANAVLGALLHRARTGRGQRVDVPMFEGLLELCWGSISPASPSARRRGPSAMPAACRGSGGPSAPPMAMSACCSTTTRSGAASSAASAGRS